MTFSIAIAETSLRVTWQDELPRFARVLSGFPRSEQTPIATVTIVRGSEVQIAASVRNRLLTFIYPRDLDDAKTITDREMLFEIGILQCAARFVAMILRTLRSPWALLHGTTIRLDTGLGVALLDDGHGLGKTSLAVALVQSGGAMVADEFAFVDTTELIATGGPAWPVHLRADVAKVLLPTNAEAQELHLPSTSLGLNTTSSAALHAILFPRVGDTFSFRKLSGPKTIERLTKATTDHLRKFCVPGADRVSVLGNRSPMLDIDATTLMNDFMRASPFYQSAKALAFYDVTLGSPDELPAAALKVVAILSGLGQQ